MFTRGGTPAGLVQLPFGRRERWYDMSDHNSAKEKIGDFLVKIGAMKSWQVEDILIVQQSGDARIFGEIAIALGYIDDRALRQYVESQRGQKQEALTLP